MRIRFISDQIYETGGPGNGPKFPSGYVLDADGIQAALGLAEPPTPEWSRRFLHRWVQRGVALEIDGGSSEADLVADAANQEASSPEPKRRARRTGRISDAADPQPAAEAPTA